MAEISDKTKITLGVAGGLLFGVLGIQAPMYFWLSGMQRELATRTEVEKVVADSAELYVRKDVLEPQMRSLQESVNAARTELSQLRVEVATLRAEGVGGK